MSEVEILRELGASVGDILEGDSGYGPSRIVITAIGRQKILCIWDHRCSGNLLGEESGHTTLSSRNWKVVGNIYNKVPRPMSSAEHTMSYSLECKCCGIKTVAAYLNSLQYCWHCTGK